MANKPLTKKLVLFFQSATFKQILLGWLALIFLFSIFYYVLTAYTGSKLMYRGITLEAGLDGFFNSLYFSFITTTSLGYGDISPMGLSKVLAVIEVMLGLFMNGILIAKLVSVKEEVILEELYDFAFDEKVDRLRTNLYYDRVNVSNFMDSKANIGTYHLLYLNLETHLLDVREFIEKQRKEREFVKELDSFRFRLILTSIELCLERYAGMEEALNSRLQLPTQHIQAVETAVSRILGISKTAKDEEMKEKGEKIRNHLDTIRRCHIGSIHSS